MTSDPSVYGLVVEFDDPEALVDAARRVRAANYSLFEAYSPYPIKVLDEIVPSHNFVPLLTLLGGLAGAAIAWILQYYVAAIEYPVNVGGRPLYSWPAFIPILFELTVLLSAGFCTFGTLGLCGFPALHHPMFNLADFARASSGRFFLSVEAADPVFSEQFTAEFLRTLNGTGVFKVDNS